MKSDENIETITEHEKQKFVLQFPQPRDDEVDGNGFNEY